MTLLSLLQHFCGRGGPRPSLNQQLPVSVDLGGAAASLPGLSVSYNEAFPIVS